ncbi:minor capsid protein [Streptomyces litchfieldiae]|uniref:Minor capsid protein n=1 Tax=Streptomyces litchfieldiae TaxID=3075543 RepID=A0ABU2MYQ8_9ACTN|nr:minor capsid protein [Streptomyces sp. DSM 44938]MDT0346759.1 minor capsid protein [Streptomyces sp. DSM 44938]
MRYSVDLLDGLARLLDAAGVGTYRPASVYTAGETAITIAAAPPEPERVIVLTAYPVAESPALTDTTTGVQVRTRAGTDPRDVEALDEAVFDVLHAAGPFTFGTARVQLIYRTSGALLGPDANGRMERTANYYARAHRAHPRLE